MFNEADRHTLLWRTLKAEIAKSLDEQRERLEKLTDIRAIAVAQGKIAAYRQIISLVEPAETPSQPATETTGPLY